MIPNTGSTVVLRFLYNSLAPAVSIASFNHDPLLVVFFRRFKLGVGVWTEVKFPWLPYRLGCHRNKDFHFLVQMLVFSFFFCIVLPWVTKYHTVQPDVNSCGLKRNRLLGT